MADAANLPVVQTFGIMSADLDKASPPLIAGLDSPTPKLITVAEAEIVDADLGDPTTVTAHARLEEDDLELEPEPVEFSKSRLEVVSDIQVPEVAYSDVNNKPITLLTADKIIQRNTPNKEAASVIAASSQRDSSVSIKPSGGGNNVSRFSRIKDRVKTIRLPSARKREGDSSPITQSESASALQTANESPLPSVSFQNI